VFGWIWSPYNAFVSVHFAIGSNRYWHHNVYYRPATVRFVPEGGNVRWAPLRPGERYRPVGYARGDPRLSQWNRPLDSGRVFVRGGPDRREWRDYGAVHAERQAEIRKTRAAQPRPDTRTVRPERGIVRPPAKEKAAQQPKTRPAPKEDPGTGATRKAVPAPGKVERQAPPGTVPAARPPEREKVREVEPKAVPAPGKEERQAPPLRSVPAARPPERGIVREPGPKSAPVPGKVERQAPPSRSVPAARPPEREIVREPEPKSAPVPGKVERQAPPSRSVPATRPPEREKVREVEPKEDRSGVPPAGRSADPGARGQEIRVYRGGDDGGQGGGVQGGGGRGR